MMIRKVAAVTLSIAMLWGGMSSADDKVQASEPATDEAALLNVMGISAVASEQYITRGDFTVLMVQTAGLEHSGLQPDSFQDVSGEQGEYIEAAAKVGYVNGAEEGRFYPDSIVSVQDAFTIALRVLGFGEAAGYSMREHMIKTLALDDAMPIGGQLTCNAANTLLMNVLESKYAVHDGTALKTSEETFLYKTHGIYRTRGTVRGIRGISLSDYPEIRDSQICIDNTVYENETDIGYDCLGGTGTVYIKEYEEYSAVIWFKGTQSDVVTVIGQNIEKASGFDKNDRGTPYISYQTENNRIKTKNIDKNSLVYLNRVNTVGISNNDLMPESGVVMIVDTDHNGTGDLVIVERYDYYMVDTVDTVSETIYSKDDKPEIQISAFSGGDLSIVYDGAETDFREIKSGIVLSVLCTYDAAGKIDSRESIVIEILNGSVSGTVESLNGEEIKINGKEYRYIPSIPTVPELGKSGIGYFGKQGELVYWVNDGANDGLSYGYLMKLISDDMEDVTYVNIFDMKGNKHKLKVDDTDKTLYSGEVSGSYVSGRKISREEFSRLFSSKQLVRYGAEGERLTKIQKAEDGVSVNGYDGYDKDRFSLDYQGSGERLYAQFLSENYKISTQTVMVGVSRNGDSDDDFAVGGYDYFGTDVSGLNVQIYDANEKFIPAVVVLTFDNLTAAAKKPNNGFVNTKFAALITAKYTKVNSDNNLVTAYEAYCGGVKVEIETEDEDLYDVKSTNWSGEGKKYFNDLEPGDVIQYGTNSKGQVDLLHVIHDHSNTTPRYTMFNANDHLSEMNTAFGKVTAYKSNSYFKLDSSETRSYPFG